MIPGGALAEREAVDEVPGFRARVVQRYVSHFYPSPKYFYIHHPEKHEICSIIQPRVNVLLFAWMNHPLFLDVYKYTYSQNYLLISPLKSG